MTDRELITDTSLFSADELRRAQGVKIDGITIEILPRETPEDRIVAAARFGLDLELAGDKTVDHQKGEVQARRIMEAGGAVVKISAQKPGAFARFQQELSKRNREDGSV